MKPRRAFTLIEILTVIAIIGVLVSLTITAGRGIQERGRIARAKADMAVIAAALEQYKQHYGDYPWTPDGLIAGGEEADGGVILFNALLGNVGPKIIPTLATRGRSFVELSKLRPVINAPANLPNPASPASTALLYNWFADPWGSWYWYHYRKAAPGTIEGDEWKSPGFLLYSHGPDGDCNIGTSATSPYRTGLLENFPPGSEAINADNVYYGRD